MEHRFIQGYAGFYIIREDGAIFNMKGTRIKVWFNKCAAYPRVSLYLNGKKKNHFVHVLVAKTFVYNPHPRKFQIVLHGDDDPSNPHRDNLSWGNQSMNMLDMIAKGRGKNQFQPQG